jgi:hypothetical protein
MFTSSICLRGPLWHGVFLAFLVPLLAAGCGEAGNLTGDVGVDLQANADQEVSTDPDGATTDAATADTLTNPDAASSDVAASDVEAPGSDVTDAGAEDAQPDGADLQDGPDSWPFDIDADTAGLELPAGCTLDVECALPVQCVVGVCKAGACTFALTEGPCDDGNACSTADKCSAGLCVAGSMVDCDDGEVCTKDTCVAATGCSHTNANGVVCDDGQACSTEDLCAEGSCTGTTAKCADDNPCTTDSCLDETGCVFLANMATCTDGNACTPDDTCTGGKCLPAAVTDCNDADPCTVDTCDLVTGCGHAPSTGPCTDGDACTEADTCLLGVCTGGEVDCDDNNPCTTDSCKPDAGCQYVANSLACSDDNPCTVADQCVAGQCKAGAGALCDDANDCTADVCLQAVGCAHTATATTCSDGNACTTGDTCVAGACKAKAVLTCDDGNPCTVDSCDLAAGCTATDADGLPCDDGQVCSTVDVCSGGSCLGAELACSDNNPCTDDTCLDGQGCVYLANDATCTDNNACSLQDACKAGSCVAGQTLDCNDNNPCTADVCDIAAGCTHTVMQGDCSDGDACTASDTCDLGECVGVTVPCDDGNPCTTDSCSARAGCQYLAVSGSCSDDNACTANDACQTGQCAAGKAVACDDNNACTLDTCDTQLGCQHVAQAGDCSDGNACTLNDVCVAGKCVPGSNKLCNDDNPCTTDGCAFDSGCVATPADGLPCDDGQACSAKDVCSDGKCQGVEAICDDNNPCTSDGCDDGTGCLNLAADATCTDGNACNGVDLCVNGSCSGSTFSCDDGNPCTVDSCVLESGCLNLPVSDGTDCNDNDACTKIDTCVQGQCQGSVPVVCTALDQCHVAGTCDPATGDCSQPVDPGTDVFVVTDCGGSNCCMASDVTGCSDPDIETCVCGMDSYCCDTEWDSICVNEAVNLCGGATETVLVPTACDDGIGCTQDDQCDLGSCVGTEADQACDDGLGCTLDICDAIDGCVHIELSQTSCDDGNVCTDNDQCLDGQCGGSGILCNDDNPCTADGCDVKKGCFAEAANDGLLCGDGNLCSAEARCQDGSCNQTKAVVCPAPGDCEGAGSCDPDTGACIYPNKTVPGLVSTCDATNCCNTGHGVACNDGATTVCVCALDSYCCTTNWDSTCIMQAIADCGAESPTIPALVPAPCDDAVGCTTDDTCNKGVCAGVLDDLACDDGNTCTADSCSQTSGCAHEPLNDGPCDDDACTLQDVCADGICTYISSVVCTALDQCHAVGTCDPATGECSNPDLVGELGPNPYYCTTSDCCSTHEAGCSDDGIESCVCELDSFCCTQGWDAQCVVAATGACANAASIAPTQAPCDDGLACTTDDRCQNGTCLAHQDTNCDDNNVCTTEVCEEGQGCVYTTNLGQCAFAGIGVDNKNKTQTELAGSPYNTNLNEIKTDCPTGEVVVGFVGRTGPSIVGLELLCSGIGADGAVLGLNPSGTWGQSSGGNEVGPIYCPFGKMIAGIDTNAGFDPAPASGSLVFTVTPRCLSTDELQFPLSPGDGTQLTTIAGSVVFAQVTQLFCPPGTAVTGLYGLAAAGVPAKIGLTCTPVKGLCLAYMPVPCDDGADCTSGNTCANGTCGTPIPDACEDNNACTIDACVPNAGCVHRIPTGQACDDGVECTSGDLCTSQGTCKGKAFQCFPGDPCDKDGDCLTQMCLNGQCAIP